MMLRQTIDRKRRSHALMCGLKYLLVAVLFGSLAAQASYAQGSGANDKGASSNPDASGAAGPPGGFTDSARKIIDRAKVDARVRTPPVQAPPQAPAGDVRNAVGIRLPNPTGAPATNPAPQAPAAAPVAAGSSPPTADVARGSALNSAAASAAGPGAVINKPGIERPGLAAPPAATTMNRAIISGTGVVRGGSGPPTVGGADKAFGVINGSNIQPRH